MNYSKNKFIAVAVIAGVSGIFGTFSFLGINDGPENNSNLETLGIGAYVTVKAYHEDGTLFQKWEGHNELTNHFRSILVGCITGAFDSNFNFSSCDINGRGVSVFGEGQSGDGNDNISRGQEANFQLVPEGCDEFFAGSCTGWSLEAVFDFNDLDCTPDVDCYDLTLIHSYGLSEDSVFPTINNIAIEPGIPVERNDRIVVTMDFEIPS